ncbi:uncharacterized protein LOC141913999 [Tubulanus polymorphus]|uniref:uncharacterized protein LOC141913999 n=1 Tax=Tubulanus polymorphus TaxID=672921 RepID=UPI003DA583B0
MATSNPDRFEISVPFKGRRVTVWSDQDNEYRTIQNYFYQPLFNLESDRITADGNILQLDITLWCEELEAAIKHELKTIYTGHVIAVQMMPFDEVKLEWRDAPSGVEIPNHPIPFNHQPQNHVFIVKCENEEMCEIYKSRLQQSPQSIGSGLVIGASRHGNEYVFRVNTVPISEARTVQPDIDQRHHSLIDNVKLFQDNLENQFSQLKHTIDTVEERLNRCCTEQQLEERLNRCCTEQQLEERLNRCCTEQQLEERLNRFCTEQQLEERLNRCCTEQQLEERLNRCCTEQQLEERLNRCCTEQQLEERLNRCCTEQQLAALEVKLNKTIDDVTGRTINDVIGRIDKLESSIGDVIDSLTISKQVQTDFSPSLVTSLPGEQTGQQSRIICAQYWESSYIYYMDDNNVMKRYIECDGDDCLLGLDKDSNGHLFVVVENNEKLCLRKYKDQVKVLEEDVTDIVSRCGTLVIRGNNIYIQLDRDVRVLRLLENPVNSLIDRNRVKKYQLPDGEYEYINSLDVDTRGRMFVYCDRSGRLLFLTADAELISFINVKDSGLTFDPLEGSPCIINDKHVLLSVNSRTGNKGAVISMRYNNEGFIDHPRIVLNSADSATLEIHKICDSNTVVICHWDNSNKPDSLRVYNINTVLTRTQ